MFDFLKRSKADDHPVPAATANEQRQAAPGTQVYYHDDLIQQLTQEHRELVKLYGNIGTAYEKGEIGKVRRQLEEFGDMLRGHLLSENIKLYVYLKHVLEQDEENTAIMQQFRTEMQHIGKAVTAFLQKYTERDWDDALRSSFGNEFAEVGKVLTRRIETEEQTLYPLYMPPDAY
jgi:hemerythrin-like domain-containing protein